MHTATDESETMYDEEIEVVSKLLKSISHPIRLKILCLLQDRELTVGEIREQVQTTNANVSQHLNILRSHGIIDFRKDANLSGDQNQYIDILSPQPVIQEEISGCGFAAVAVLAGVSYQEVKRRANAGNIYAEDEKLFSDTNYVRELLAEYKIKCSNKEHPFSKWHLLPDTALLAVKWREINGIPYWHWVVFHRGRCETVLDSKRGLKNNVRTDFGRIKPKWYIEIF